MNKKQFIFLVVICIGLFMPREVFAFEVYNNVNIDYRFFVDEDNNNAGNLKFKLYDKSGILNFESKYDTNTKQYYFEFDEIKHEFFDYYSYYENKPIDRNNYESTFRDYIPHNNEIGNIEMNFEKFNTFKNKYGYHGVFDFGGYASTWVYYSYIPLIFYEETTGNKKIVFASLSVRNDDDFWSDYGSYYEYYTQLLLINNSIKWKEDPIALGHSFLDNVDFMRKTMLDYSDELWEELNNGPIASSEIYNDIISSESYNYNNRSISGNQYNLPEETIDDYANSIPILSFKKEESNKPSSVVSNIINPKTFTNGIFILGIVILFSFGFSLFIIKRKSKNSI